MKHDPQRILILKHGAMGDFCYAIGPMQAIVRAHPQNDYVLLTTPAMRSLAEATGLFHSIIEDPRAPIWNFPAWWRLWRWARKQRFSRIYDLQWSQRSNLYGRYLFSRKIGPWVAPFPHAHFSCPTSSVSDLPAHAALAVMLRETVHIPCAPPDFSFLRDPFAELPQNVRNFPAFPSPIVLLAPGSSPKGAWKRWPVEHFAQLARFLAETLGVIPVFMCSDPELLPCLREKCAAFPLIAFPSYAMWATMSTHAQAAIGNDTGPMHLLALLGLPSLILFEKRGTPKTVCPPNARALQSDGAMEHLSPLCVMTDFQKMWKALNS